MKKTIYFLSIFMLLVSGKCKKENKTAIVEKFKLSTSSFTPGGIIPDSLSCKAGSKEKFPQLSWSGLPAGTQSLALIMDDPDAIPVAGNIWIHWVLYDIPVSEVMLGPGFNKTVPLPASIKRGKTSFGDTLYGGPCPPSGQTHTYYFRLFAINKKLNLASGNDAKSLRSAMQGFVLDSAILKGSFSQ